MYLASADVRIISFTSMIWTLLLGRIVLDEKITPFNSTAVFIGFFGVIVIAQPTILMEYNIRTGADFKDLNSFLHLFILLIICVSGSIFPSIGYVILRKTGVLVPYQVIVFYFGIVGGIYALYMHLKA